MSSYNELLTKREQLLAEIHAVNQSIQLQTGLPFEWNILPQDCLPMAGGIALVGPCENYDREEQATISITTEIGFFIQDEDHNRSLYVDPEAVRAALKIYDLHRGVKCSK